MSGSKKATAERRSPGDGPVRIGLWAAFWGDTNRALEQVLSVPELDYLVSDYLAEITMALLARARAKDPAVGFVGDAVDTLGRVLPTISARGIKVVTNAGALNPAGCAVALRELIREAGLDLRVASVTGDDLLPRKEDLLAGGVTDMFTDEEVPSELSSLNAYLGARPIAAALDRGADIVVTGRCVDAAVVLGPLMHEYGWADDDYDLLAAGALAGHVIECGPQCTGGIHTDWDLVPGWENLGYPIAEISADGTAVITKPSNTGGMVTTGTVAEQILYEIGDPGAYVLPDVVCDWRNVTATTVATDRVRLAGAKGRPPTDHVKATGTYADGFRAMTTAMFAGVDAAGRARRAGEALVARTERLVEEDGYGPLTESSVEVVGAGDLFGAERRNDAATEAVVKIGVRHPERAALEVFSREFAPMGLVAQGMAGVFAGRPRVAPVFRIYHLLIPKSSLGLAIDLGDGEIGVETSPGSASAVIETPARSQPGKSSAPWPGRTVALRTLAYGRSGDKGDKANIGVIPRDPRFAELIAEQVTDERVAAFFGHFLGGDVRSWSLPGLGAINFLLDEVLGGSGGTSTLRYDPQGKSYAAMLLTMPVTIPVEWESKGLLAPNGSPS